MTAYTPTVTATMPAAYLYDAAGQRRLKLRFDGTGAVTSGSRYCYDRAGHLITEYDFDASAAFDVYQWAGWAMSPCCRASSTTTRRAR